LVAGRAQRRLVVRNRHASSLPSMGIDEENVRLAAIESTAPAPEPGISPIDQSVRPGAFRHAMPG
jgi:hypothetical protein